MKVNNLVMQLMGVTSTATMEDTCIKTVGGAENDGHEIAGHENGGPNSMT